MDINEANIVNKIRVGVFMVSLRTDGLVHVHASGDEIDLPGYKKLVEEMAKMTSWKKYLFYVQRMNFLFLMKMSGNISLNRSRIHIVWQQR